MPSIYQPRRRASPLWQIVHRGRGSFIVDYVHRKFLGPLRHGTKTAATPGRIIGLFL